MGCEVLSEGPEMWPDRLPLAGPLACPAHADRMTWAVGVRGLRDGGCVDIGDRACGAIHSGPITAPSRLSQGGSRSLVGAPCL